MTAIKERPILFNGAMVRAILEGRKTVTRRACKPQPSANAHTTSAEGKPMSAWWETGKDVNRCPYGQPGDRLWVRETWQLHEKFTDNCVVVYKASERNSWTEFHRRFPVEVARGCQAKPFQTHGFRPSIHMPRWASRILLEIAAVRVERLQDITRSDIRAEGLQCPIELQSDDVSPNYRDWYPAAFRELWNSTGGSWEANPWVWVVEFKRIEQ